MNCARWLLSSVLCLLAALAFGQGGPNPTPGSSAFGRTLLSAPDAASANALLGGSVGIAAGRVVYVATNGNDGASGAASAPVLTLNHAVDLLRATNGAANGTVMIGAGTYTGQYLILSNADAVNLIGDTRSSPQFWYGNGITNWTSAGSNGIYYAAATADLLAITALASNYSPAAAALLWELGTPYGAKAGMDPMVENAVLKDQNYRLPHTPLVNSTTMKNQWWQGVNGHYLTNLAELSLFNGRFYVTNSTVFVRFSDGGAPAGRVIWVPSTHTNDCFMIGATAAAGQPLTEAHVKNVAVYFAYEAFRMAGLNAWSLDDCLAFGPVFGGVTMGDADWATIGASARLTRIEVAGSGASAVAFVNDPINAKQYISVVEVGCYYHDGATEASISRGAVNRLAIDCLAEENLYGWIDDGGESTYLRCRSRNTHLAGWQQGSGQGGLWSRTKLYSCRMDGDAVGYSSDFGSNTLFASDTCFNPNSSGVPLRIQGDGQNTRLVLSGCYSEDTRWANNRWIVGQNATNAAHAPRVYSGTSVPNNDGSGVMAWQDTNGFHGSFSGDGAGITNLGTINALTMTGGLTNSTGLFIGSGGLWSTPLGINVYYNGKIGVGNGYPGTLQSWLSQSNLVTQGVLANTATLTNGVVVKSNSWVTVPTLASGDTWYAASNGVPTVIWKDQGGTLHTNRLVP